MKNQEKEKVKKRRKIAAWFLALPLWVKVSVIALTLAIFGGAIFAFDKISAHKTALGELKIEFKKELTFEYAKKKIAVEKDVISKVEGKISKINPQEISLEKLGKTNVEITIEKSDKYGAIVSKTETASVEVKDTKAPVIELKSEKVEIVKGADIDLKENVASAKDPVDGDVEVQVNGNVNKDQTGEYDVKVIAKDKNNNESSKDYKVVVNEAPAANETVTQVVENGRTVYKTQSGKTYTSVPSTTPVAPSASAPVVKQGQATAPSTPVNTTPSAPVATQPAAPSVVCNPNGLMALINSYRAQNGRSTLAYNASLASGAQAWSATPNAARGVHGSGYFDENITVTSGDASTALSNFIGSSAHNAIQLNAENTSIGVGCTVQQVGYFQKAVYVVRFVD